MSAAAVQPTTGPIPTTSLIAPAPAPLESHPSSAGPSEEHSDLFARLFRPKASLCDNIFEVSIDTLHCVSYPATVSEPDRVPAHWNAALPPDPPTDGTATIEDWIKRASAHRASSRHEISLFNVVFVMDVPPGVDPSVRVGLGAPMFDDVAMVRDTVRKLSVCLMHEQRRVRYLSQQVLALLDAGEHRPAGHEALLATQLARSSLAKELVSVFEGLRDHRSAHVSINKWLRLSVGLAHPAPT